jgi:hypothetical protein
MLYITVPDMNDSLSSISIDGVLYYLRFTYNEENNYWNFGVYDENEEPIVAMVKIVPYFPLLYQYQDSRLPEGEFCAFSDYEQIQRQSFNQLEAEFVYFTKTDLKNMGEDDE